jgi:hypothetical protein
MIEQNENVASKPKKTYTGRDVIEAAKEMLRSDNIGKKLPDAVVEKLSKLLAQTALKGDL